MIVKLRMNSSMLSMSWLWVVGCMVEVVWFCLLVVVDEVDCGVMVLLRKLR